MPEPTTNAPPGLGSCDACKFWLPIVNDVESRGECRHYAPSPSAVSVVWPRTHAYDWCGEWEKVPPTPAVLPAPGEEQQP